MVSIDVYITDYDNPEFEETCLQLPCNLAGLVSPGIQYCIESSTTIMLSEDDNLFTINKALEEINAANPELSLDELEALNFALGDVPLTSKQFLETIVEGRFFIENVTEHVTDDEISYEEVAQYMLLQKKIPFCKDCPSEFTDAIINNPQMRKYVDWSELWLAYESYRFMLIEHMEEYYLIMLGQEV
ncbi:MAG: hypothetical protein RR365_01170 [Bacteroides sp.]